MGVNDDAAQELAFEIADLRARIQLLEAAVRLLLRREADPIESRKAPTVAELNAITSGHLRVVE